MSLRSEINDALLELETDLQEEVTFYVTGTTDTLSVPCVSTMVTDADRLISGGFESDASMALNVRVGNFLTADNTLITVDSTLFTADNSSAKPRANKKCKFRKVEYRIITASEDPTRAYLHLVLGPKTR